MAFDINWAVLGVYMGLFLALYFEVFLLISYLEKKPSKKTKTLPAHYPSITMIVPCFNEGKTVKQTVESLLALKYPKDKIEILIVDDGSTDDTRAIGEALAAAEPRVKYFHKENGGKYTALNFGILQSKADLVGCLDADSFVAPDALLEVAKRFEQDKSIMAITPSMQVYRPHTLLELMQAVEYTFGIFYKKMFDNLSSLNVLPGPFSIYKREIFAKIGPFRHAHNTEDMEIAFRMHAHGLKIANAHNAFVFTTVPTTVWKLIKQRTRWSQGFLQNSQDYRYMYFNRRFGNFGMFILPFMLISFVLGLYVAVFALYNVLYSIFSNVSDYFATGIPPHFGMPHIDLYFLNLGMMSVLVTIVMCMTLLAIALGQRIVDSRIGIKSLIAYFTLFGFVAPIWLARAAWGAITARESAWR